MHLYVERFLSEIGEGYFDPSTMINVDMTHFQDFFHYLDMKKNSKISDGVIRIIENLDSLSEEEIDFLQAVSLLNDRLEASNELYSKYLTLTNLTEQCNALKIDLEVLDCVKPPKITSDNYLLTELKSRDMIAFGSEGSYLSALKYSFLYFLVNNYLRKDIYRVITDGYVFETAIGKNHHVAIAIWNSLFLESNASFYKHTFYTLEDFNNREDVIRYLNNTITSALENFQIDHLILELNKMLEKKNNDPKFYDFKIEDTIVFIEHVDFETIKGIVAGLIEKKIHTSGFPDITLCKDGKISLWEVKAGKDKLRYSQLLFIQTIYPILKKIIKNLEIKVIKIT